MHKKLLTKRIKSCFWKILSVADIFEVDNQFDQRHHIVRKDGIFAEVNDVDFDVISVEKRVIKSQLQFLAAEGSPPLIFCFNKGHNARKTEIET